MCKFWADKVKHWREEGFQVGREKAFAKLGDPCDIVVQNYCQELSMVMSIDGNNRVKFQVLR